MKLYKIWQLIILFFLFINYSFAATPTSNDDKSDSEHNKSSIPALEGLTGSFTLATDYIFRGQSLSNNLPAVQGGLNYSLKKTGIYFAIWSSSTDLPFPEINQTATVEIDPLIGITNDITEHLSYNIGITHYAYPKAQSFEYNELLTKWTYNTGKAWSFFMEVDYSNNVFNTQTAGVYYNGTVSYAIPPTYAFGLNNMNFNASIGYYHLSPEVELYSYNDYKLELTKTIGLYTISLQWTGTDNQYFYDGTLGHKRLLATLTANF